MEGWEAGYNDGCRKRGCLRAEDMISVMAES